MRSRLLPVTAPVAIVVAKIVEQHLPLDDAAKWFKEDFGDVRVKRIAFTAVDRLRRSMTWFLFVAILGLTVLVFGTMRVFGIKSRNSDKRNLLD